MLQRKNEERFNFKSSSGNSENTFVVRDNTRYEDGKAGFDDLIAWSCVDLLIISTELERLLNLPKKRFFVSFNCAIVISIFYLTHSSRLFIRSLCIYNGTSTCDAFHSAETLCIVVWVFHLVEWKKQKAESLIAIMSHYFQEFIVLCCYLRRARCI